jgi:hypothetical protein
MPLEKHKLQKPMVQQYYVVTNMKDKLIILHGLRINIYLF